jgi:hypothetical protein
MHALLLLENLAPAEAVLAYLDRTRNTYQGHPVLSRLAETMGYHMACRVTLRERAEEKN